ncbi:hypothetical protein wTpre_1025 [Wolbachia endosymbiont of Trichogramma pretiosum]|nr:hypothetical protein wTpre_1025 [Wolbachia endosymbiont of Trichogramma pretiosum]
MISHELIHRYIGHIIEQDNDKKMKQNISGFLKDLRNFME